MVGHQGVNAIPSGAQLRYAGIQRPFMAEARGLIKTALGWSWRDILPIQFGQSITEGRCFRLPTGLSTMRGPLLATR